MAKAPAPQQPGMLSLDQASKLLMLTPKRIRQLHEQGHIPMAGRNQYPLVGVVQGYVKFLKDEERRTSKSAAASRVTDARADEIELRTKQRLHQLIDIDEHDEAVATGMGTLRAALAGVPVRFTRDVAQRRRLEDEINAALTVAADRLAQEGASLRAHGVTGEAEPEDDA